MNNYLEHHGEKSRKFYTAISRRTISQSSAKMSCNGVPEGAGSVARNSALQKFTKLYKNTQFPKECIMRRTQKELYVQVLALPISLWQYPLSSNSLAVSV